jgi:hypothetical protein
MKPISQAMPMTGAASPGRCASRTRSVRVRAGFGTVRELYRTLVDNGRWWMFPMIGILGFTSLLLIAIAAIEYVAPFVYTIF